MEGLFGSDLAGNPILQNMGGKIANKYLVPPFSLLNTRDGAWQFRKKMWIKLGIKSELGRDSITYNIGDKKKWDEFKKITVCPNGTRRSIEQDGCFQRYGASGASIFDPVLTELMYTWFCPPNGQIIDPFAGGSVRGIVAKYLGFDYWGCDLSENQIKANIKQAQSIIGKRHKINWECGDSLKKLKNAPKADFIFTCPPYGDLEKYSDHKKDLSNMEYSAFISSLKKIILKSTKKLKNNRFACIVIGDFRDKKGFYRGFVSDTVQIFQEQGLHLYNECILINSVGSLPIRIQKQFDSYKKMGKTHQNVLIFYKGDDPKQMFT